MNVLEILDSLHRAPSSSSIAWEHHECQDHAEEENGVEKETEGGRAAGRACEIHPSQDFVHNFIGFGVGT